MSITQDNGNRADREKLKTYFETGDRPTEEEFSQTIDSWINQLDDDLHATGQKIGIGTDAPKSKLHVKSAGGDASNSDGIFRVDSTGGGAEGSIHFGVLPKDHTWIQSKEKVPLHINPVANNTIINLKAGNVGIGTNNPTDKLQVGNGISKLVFGSAYDANTGWGTSYIGFNLGRKQGNWFTNTDTSSNGGAVIYGDVNGNVRFSAVKTNNPITGLTLTDAQVKQNTKMFISVDGNVGVGTDSPQSKLHVHQIGNTTGLKLSGQSSAAIGDILTLDSTGNAKWLPPTSVTSGLWKAIGTTGHIENGNGGNVGIGTNAPTEKLHINGNLKIDNGSLAWKSVSEVFTIKRSNDDGAGSYIEMFGSTINHDNQGGISFVATGDGQRNGFNFLNHNSANNQWSTALRIDGTGNQHIYNHNIYFRGDDNHGIGWFGTGKTFAGQVVDGPVSFGYLGGALGTNQNGAQDIALQWFRDNRVDFKSKLTTNNLPFFVKMHYTFDRFMTVDDPDGTTDDSNNKRIISDYPPSHYHAIIGNFSFNHFNPGSSGSGQVSVWIEQNGTNNQWSLVVRFPNSHNSEKMVDVFFVRKELF